MRKSLCLSIAAAALAWAQSPTGEQIVDRYVEVTGGRSSYEKVRTETVTGVMEMKAQGIKGRTTGYKNERGESYNAVEIDGVGTIEEGFSGGVAWEKSAMSGPRIKSGEEKAFFAREAAVGKDVRWRDFFAKAELQGEETIGGVACYKVAMTPKDGSRGEVRFYEKESGLLRRVSMVMATHMGDLPVESQFGGYKEFGGIRIPTTILTKMAGQEISLSILNVEHNKDLPAERLVPPADVRALAEKQSKKAN